MRDESRYYKIRELGESERRIAIARLVSELMVHHDREHGTECDCRK